MAGLPRRRSHPLQAHTSVAISRSRKGDILQKDLRIRAALSHSLSKVVGQKASDPILFENLFIGAPTEECQTSFHPARDSRLTFVCPGPGLIETLLTRGLGLVPRWEHRSHLLHLGWSSDGTDDSGCIGAQSSDCGECDNVSVADDKRNRR